MTNDIESFESRGPAWRWLPWLLGAGALVLFVFTLNHWISMLNVGTVARLSGWTWQPEALNAAYYLLTLPLYLLPETFVPIALNLFSACCAALALVQLARSVMLLPHDRTHDQREREVSDGAVFSGKLRWVPPVLAVFMCSLQLTFWEHATNGTPEMLDLLLFAFVIRALLEYRYHGEERWLSRAALVMGAGMSCNAAMLAFFPIFIASLVWIRGIGFFNARFLIRTLICGLIGLSLYLFLPLVASIKSPELIGFWDALRFNVASQKQILLMFPRKTLILLSLTSVVPIILISIRWASYFGDTSQTGQLFATAAFHALHAAFLGAAVWVALDPPFSPRNAGYGLAFLPLYYFGALAAGYFAGYFLLVFGPRIETRMRRAPTPIIDLIHKFSTAAVLALLVIAPVALVFRNSAEIRTTNGPLLRNYAANLMENLPGRALLVSDDFAHQFIAEAWISSENRSKDYMVVNSEWLKWDTYHRYLHQRHGNAWPAPEKAEGKPTFTPQMLIGLLTQAARSNQVHYLHPSFGYYFEAFRPEPHGLTYELKPYSAGELLPPKPSDDLIAKNEDFFSGPADKVLKPILAVTHNEGRVIQYVGTGPFRKVRLRRHKNATAIELGRHYSRVINTWGVELQKAGKFETAARHFELAVRLNADNVVAVRNLDYNRKFRAGEPPIVEIPKSAEDLFGAGRSWDQVLTANGPYDDPSLRLLQAYLFLQTGLYRQSAECFNRVREFSATDFSSRLWLAQLQLLANRPDAALEIASEIHAHPERFPLDPTNRIDLLTVEGSALFANKSPAKAVELIESTLAAHPLDEQLLVTAASIYTRHEQFSNSLAVVDRMLAINSNNPTALLNKGYLFNQLKLYDQGIAALDRLLTLETNHPYGLLNRGAAYLQSNRLPEAKADYEALVRMYPTSFQPYYDLSEIALRQGDTNAAIRYAETFLNSSPTSSAEHQTMQERLRSLKGEKTR